MQTTIETMATIQLLPCNSKRCIPDDFSPVLELSTVLLLDEHMLK